MSDSVITWTAAHQSPLSTISQSLLKIVSLESVMPYNHLILCCPLSFLPSIFPSIRVSSNELAQYIKTLNQLFTTKDYNFCQAVFFYSSALVQFLEP